MPEPAPVNQIETGAHDQPYCSGKDNSRHFQPPCQPLNSCTEVGDRDDRYHYLLPVHGLVDWASASAI